MKPTFLFFLLTLSGSAFSQSDSSRPAEFCETVKYLVNECKTTLFRSIRGKDIIAGVKQQSTMRLEGFEEEAIIPISSMFEAVYEQKAYSTEQANRFVDELTSRLSQCTNYKLYNMGKKLRYNMFLDEAKGVFVILSAEKLSKGSYAAMIRITSRT